MIVIVLLTAMLAAAAPAQRGLVLPQIPGAAGPSFIQRTEPGHRVSGRVYPDENRTVGSPAAGLPAPALPARGNFAEIAGQTQTGSKLTEKLVLGLDGKFSFESIPPGAYRVSILPASSIIPAEIQVTDRNVEVQFGRPPIRVFGTVAVEDGGPPPPFELRFNDASDDGSTPLRNHVRVAGSFIADLAPGAYRLFIDNLPTGFSVKSVSRTGVDFTSRDLNVVGPEAVEIAVILGVSVPPPWVRVNGRVVNSPDGPPITAVSLDGDKTAGTLKAAVHPDGSFEFPKVLPGSYFARTLPSAVAFHRDVAVGPRGVARLEMAGPQATDFAGEFVRVAPGDFIMGCAADDSRCLRNEKPARRVGITRAFEIGKYEVTQKQWEAVMGSIPSDRKGQNLPVDNVGWQDTQEFIARLNALGGAYRYRLPTEAEWEFAAKSGSNKPDPDKAASEAFGWFLSNGSQPHPVGEKLPNAWGLHDMRGNVAEWVEDWYDPGYYVIGPALDPAGPLTGPTHVLRGGSSGSFPDAARVSSRSIPEPFAEGEYIGFRLARERRP